LPYDRNSQLPKGARHALPGHAQSIFRNVVNSALASGASDESAHRQAWGVVGRGYKRPKGGGMWSRRTGKAGAGALNYPSWTTQSQKNGDDEDDLLDLPSNHLGKFNPNHDERGRFSSGPGGGGTTTSMAMAARAKGGKSSLKSLRSAFQSTVKQRRKLDSSIATLKNRMTQYKRSSPAHKKAFVRLQSLRLQRTELTRELNRLSSAIVRSAGGKSYHQDWVSSILAGFPVVQPTSSRPSRKSADADLFEIRRPFT
jgi:cation transport regulator ChaB